MSVTLHPKWEGVWEIRGNSRWNGERMIIVAHKSNNKLLTMIEASTMDKFEINGSPENNLEAHWNFQGKIVRYYIGTLNKNFGSISWFEMKRNRQTDTWWRIKKEPIAYLERCTNKIKAKPITKRKLNYTKKQLHQNTNNSHNKYQNQHYRQHQNNHNDGGYDKPHSRHQGGGYHNDHYSKSSHEYYKPKNRDNAHNGNNYDQHQSQKYRNNYNNKNYPQPRTTKLEHQQKHEPRFNNRNRRKFQKKDENNIGNKAAVLDGYFDSNPKTTYQQHREREQKRGQRRRDQFTPHITKEEAIEVIKESKDYPSQILYVGEVSLSRFNPNVAYVSVDGIKKDVRISGFLDRNRAYDGDHVIISLYPEIEWMQAVKQDLIDFENRLDLRDKQKKEDVDNDNNDINNDNDDNNNDNANNNLDVEEQPIVLSENQNASSSSSEDPDTQKNNEEEVIYMSSSNEDKDINGKEKEKADKNTNKLPEIVFSKPDKHETNNSKWKPKNRDKSKDKKMEHQLFKKESSRWRKIGELNDKKSLLAYDKYLWLKEQEKEFKKISERYPKHKLRDEDHPQKNYITQIINKSDGKLPSECLSSFKWCSPNDHLDKVSRGKVIGIYSRKSSRECIPGFLLPILYGKTGNIDRRWALFTPLDKRYPKAQFPMRELPKPLLTLFNKYEKEEYLILEEYDNRLYDARKQNLSASQIRNEIKKRSNQYETELRLLFLDMTLEDKWNYYSFHPKCHLKSVLGKRGQSDVETNIILSKHGITWRQTFNKKIEDFVKDMSITEKDFTGRRDCRHLRVFSIDPTSARDFDDALSINELTGEFDKNGKKLYKIGIHIADVTHFVKPGSVVDVEAQNRATSVYLVDRCLPMLPHHLCQNLCSLNPDVDRLAYSVFVILNEEGHLISRPGTAANKYQDKSPWFGKSVIRSRARLNYETAHFMLVDEVTADTKLDELDECCMISNDTNLKEIIDDTKLFWSIAKQMRERRFDNGSVKFFRPHIRFRLDKKNEHKVLKFGPEILLSSNHLIEEMMLLANQLVANQLINKVKTHTLLRRHPKPVEDKKKKIDLICRSQNIEMKMDTPKELNDSLAKMDKIKYGGVSAAKVVNVLLAQTMQRAQYIIVEKLPEAEWRHWALAFPMYTHFTSPIRRYADVLVHRLLNYTVYNDNDNDDAASLFHKDELVLPSIDSMKKQCTKCNDRNSAAHFAEMDSQTIHLCLMLIDRPIVVDVIIVDMMNHLFIVVVPGLGLDVRCNVSDVMRVSNGQIVRMNVLFQPPDSTLVIKWKNGEEEHFKLFGRLRIRLSSELRTPIQLVTSIINPSKRKYVQVANRAAIAEEDEHLNNDEEEQNPNDDEKVNDDDYNYDDEDEDDNPVAMTLDSQRKVGTADYYNAHYD